ncbi:MAG TPA: ATPase domain-containing protein [Kofleriaceae bacterium]|nr:ATPase domain-containing protein [Kofleriaceae bacterium]
MAVQSLVSTGVAGLDLVLGGGVPRDRIYLVQGDPGVGKTTLGMQFLRAGVAAGETCLYIALSESRDEIASVVESHGWTLDGLHVVELSAIDQTAGLDAENTLFEPSEVELQETTRRLLAEIERARPDRVVFDSLSELRLLAQTPLRYRRQILALKQYFADKRTTVLLLDDRTSDPTDLQLQSLAHGVVSMEQAPPLYGADRRSLRIAKLRGVRFLSGYHDFAIRTGGLEVFPRLVPGNHKVTFARGQVSSGIAELDQMLGGGVDHGTATLLLGPAGAGKSSIAVQYAVAAVQRGDHAAMFVFDERLATVYERTRALGVDLEALIATGRLSVQQVDPAELSAGEFAYRVHQTVDRDRSRVVVIDSLNGYLHAMASDKQLTVQLHELLSYLGNAGVATLMVMAQHGLAGSMKSPVDVSYLADTLVLLRYFENQGRVRKAISVLKKRSGAHELAIRELSMGPGGLVVGAPLTQFAGVLTGVPNFVGSPGDLAHD